MAGANRVREFWVNSESHIGGQVVLSLTMIENGTEKVAGFSKSGIVSSSVMLSS